MSYSKDILLAKITFSRKDIGEMAKKEALARMVDSFAGKLGKPVVRWQDDGSVEVVIPYNPKP